MFRKKVFLVSIILCFFLSIVTADQYVFGQNREGDHSQQNLNKGKFSTSRSASSTDGNTVGKDQQETLNPGTPSVQEKALPGEESPTDQDRDKARDLMEEALELIDDSRNYWIKGDVEGALDLLDQAYSLLMDSDGEPDIVRQKDDVRLLIAQRIISIYSSMQSSTIGKRSEIPLIVNEDVEKEIRSFQTIERDFFVQSYKRSATYRPIILRELRKAGLPEELSWLPLVESGFKIHALSRARALGLWQFIPSTGYKYGLNRDEWVDERLDVEKSTRAAIDYLKELHGMFGDWLTVLAAYNCGEGRVLKVISRQHINYFDRFWDLYHNLPYETARYVPRFLATIQIIRNQKKYGINLEGMYEKEIPFSYETVNTYKSMRLEDIAKHTGTDEEVLNTLNAELRQKITPDKEYHLKIPSGMSLKFASVVEEIPKVEKPQKVFIRHRAKRGETVVSIARKYRTSVSEIVEYNHISSRKKLRAGQILTIPVQGHIYSRAKYGKQYKGKLHSKDGIAKYRVKKGDTLNSVARQFGVTVDEIKRVNGIKGNTLRVGQIIRVGSKSSGSEKLAKKTTDKKTAKTPVDSSGDNTKKYVVQKGDTLGKIAKKNGVNVERILEINKISRDEILQQGQVIVVK